MEGGEELGIRGGFFLVGLKRIYYIFLLVGASCIGIVIRIR